jgi:DNA-binding response OmpR family regulator
VNRTLAPRVLIAEDEPSIVTSLDFLMRKAGFETRTVRDGADALEAVAQFRPDLVILDLMLPRVSGLDVCRQVRGHPEWSGTRVLMLTARGSGADLERGLAAGADDYVVKPFSTHDLVARVKRLLPP